MFRDPRATRCRHPSRLLDPIPLVVGEDGQLQQVGLGRQSQVFEPLSWGLSCREIDLRYLIGVMAGRIARARAGEADKKTTMFQRMANPEASEREGGGVGGR